MGPCCVEGCVVTSEETFYFEFPTSRLLRRKWLEAIPIPGKLPLGTVVCSRHFSADDYENVRGKVRLKRKVVPTLLLDEKKQTPPKDITSPQSPRKPDCDSTTLSAPSPADDTDLPPDKTGDDDRVTSDDRPSDDKHSRDDIRSGDDIKSSDDMNGDDRIGDDNKIGDGNKQMEGIVEQNGGGEDVVVKSPPPLPSREDKEDIEEMITNYQIKNKVPNPALLADLVQDETGTQLARQSETEAIQIDGAKESEPVFIEVSVDKDTSATEAGSQDCLMLLESVQVDVDPNTLLLTHDEEYYRQENTPSPAKKEDPISLLTSSDEDDVIIQEPHIDTVEVSDATDEDDMPLVKLVKKKPNKNKLLKKKLKKVKAGILDKIMWNAYDFYCVQCHFSTKSSAEYQKHLATHSTVLQVCQICGYTSASKNMYARHVRIHKVEKKFKCHLCDYRARHKMSLSYHLKNHENGNVKCKTVCCPHCGLKSVNKVFLLQHLRLCVGDKKHVCDKCEYSTKKKSDLRRHKRRVHLEASEDDDDYIPGA